MEVNLRDIKENDSDFLYQLYISRNSEDILTPINYTDQKKFVKDFLKSKNNHPYEDWKIIEINNKSIGSVTLNKNNNELGFWIIPEFQGCGIGSIAVKKLMKLAKKDYYSAIIRPENLASKSLVEKLGFNLTHHKYLKKNNLKE